MSEPIIVNGSKLSEEELKQLLEEIKKPSPKMEKAVLFLLTEKRKTALFRAAFRAPVRTNPL